MICVYPAEAVDFANNGLCVLMPSACTVTETLNGEWELSMTHPLDENEKWTYLQVGCIIRAPVPAAMTPRVTMSAVTSSTEGYSVYRVNTSNGSNLIMRSGPGMSYKQISKYRKGTEVILVNKTNSQWYEVTAPDGKHGYMYADRLVLVRTVPGTTVITGTDAVVEAKQLRDQPFRIYRIAPTLTEVQVYARHIFYDLMDNIVLSYKPSGSVSGMQVALSVLDQCESDHDFTMYSNLTETADDISFEYVNPVEAFLGDSGIVKKYSAELARDWFDVYLVDRVGQDTDVEIRQGKNLLGISYDIDDSSVITRVRLIDYFTTIEQPVVIGTKQVLMDFLSTGDGIAFASDSTKTKSSRRTLPLVKPIKDMLLRLLEQQEENKRICGKSWANADGYLCVNSIGERMKPAYLSAAFSEALDNAGLRHIRFHDLRHSCASLLLANGIPLKQIQEWLGHSDFSTTANIYAHLDSESRTKSANIMEKALSFDK